MRYTWHGKRQATETAARYYEGWLAALERRDAAATDAPEPTAAIVEANLRRLAGAPGGAS